MVASNRSRCYNVCETANLVMGSDEESEEKISDSDFDLPLPVGENKPITNDDSRVGSITSLQINYNYSMMNNSNYNYNYNYS